MRQIRSKEKGFYRTFRHFTKKKEHRNQGTDEIIMQIVAISSLMSSQISVSLFWSARQRRMTAPADHRGHGP